MLFIMLGLIALYLLISPKVGGSGGTKNVLGSIQSLFTSQTTALQGR